jgi:hypothetical protein
MSEEIDIGHGHFIKYFGWHPDRDINPQYDGIPDIEKVCVNVRHSAPDGSKCISSANFDTPEIRKLFGDHVWKVESWEPLTLSPSLLCMRCGDHGFIRDGKWIKA